MPKTPKETTPEQESALPNLKAGFAILIDELGNVYVERDVKALALPVEREATLIEIRRYLSEILMDLQAQAAAEYTAIRISPPETK